jgi:hypothetical protein
MKELSPEEQKQIEDIKKKKKLLRAKKEEDGDKLSDNASDDENL